MGILEFFHKITMYFVRDSEDFIPDMNEAQRYGNDGEDALIRILCREMPCCKIKRNVFVSTDEGNAEIDCLVLYRDKLFAIEVKCWKGKLIDQGDDFLKEKTDTLTEQVYRKHLKSPFKQLGRAVYLLKKQIPVKAWINTVVFFEADALASISVRSDDVWFERIPDLVNYIRKWRLQL
ncbi:MAG: NERD domain-containing protein [Clostridia bacterium]|nr:NERD domain-containing protein [Clostridia bacterium]